MPPVSGPKTLLLDLYGAYGRRLDNWFAVAILVELMGTLDQDEQAVRSAISRMTSRGILEKDRRSGSNGYRLARDVLEAMALGDRRIYGPLEPSSIEDGWSLVTFSVPESERQNRYLLRSRLEWLGYGNASNAVWIAPASVFQETRALVARLEMTQYVDLWIAHFKGSASLRELVERSWNLHDLNEHYTMFLDTSHDLMADSDHDPQQAFADYTILLHKWRKLPFIDPGLPADLLPSGWAGGQARRIFESAREKLEGAAFQYVLGVVGKRP